MEAHVEGTAGSEPMLSIVVPVRDEESSVDRLVSEIESVFGAPPPVKQVEVVIVDDCSRDATLDKVQTLRSGRPWLRVVCHHHRLGQSAAIWHGVDRARGSWIATLDGDGQNDPRDIPRLLHLAEAHEAIHGSVLIAGHRIDRHDPTARKRVSWVSNHLSAVVLRHPVIDRGCGLKVFRREQFLSLPHFDHMHRFLPPLFMLRGAQIESVPVTHRPREHGTSHYRSASNLVDSIVDVLGVRWLKARYFPQDTCDEL